MIRAVSYTTDGVETFDDVAAAHEAPGRTWVAATEATTAELEAVGEEFGLHPLTIEDVTRDVRPKFEEYDDYTLLLVKTARLRRGDTTFGEELHTSQVGLFLGEDWLVTASPAAVDAVDRVWEEMLAGNARMLRLGVDFAAYRVLDRIVDDYFLLLDDLEDTIETIEDGVLDGPDPDVLELLNDVRRDLLVVRKLLWPTREAVGYFARGDPDEVQEATEKYYRDVYDHLVQLVDLTETYRDLVTGSRDIYLSTLSQSTNEVMKTLTVVATILLPLTFVVGVYGMNFSDAPFNMPELAWPYAYPAVMLGMALVSGVLLVYFRREGWL